MKDLISVPCAQGGQRGFASAALTLCALLWGTAALAEESEVRLPSADPTKAIRIQSDRAHTWKEGSYQVWLLQGSCRIEQGDRLTTCREAVLWLERVDHPDGSEDRILAHLEGHVQIQGADVRLTERVRFARLLTRAGIQIHVPQVYEVAATQAPVYLRASERFRPAPEPNPPGMKSSRRRAVNPSVAGNPSAADLAPVSPIRPAQFAVEMEELPAVGAPVVQQESDPNGSYRIRAFPRGEAPIQLDSFPLGDGAEQATIITGGVNLLIEGLEAESFGEVGTLDLAAERMIIWTEGGLDLTGATRQEGGGRIEVYLEGNVVLRQGPREIYAKRVYYDVTRNQGVILDAELLTPLPPFDGRIRIKADVIRQFARDRFVASGAWVSTSELARPTYRWQSGE
ncbi:MAG: LptA/OstA family protein, partial [Planctomycetales bacterium]